MQNNNNHINNLALNLCQRELVCTISTINKEGVLEASAMAFTSFDDFTIAFQTPITTRKYQNLKDNPHVAIVIGWDLKDMKTIQYEGLAKEVTDENEIHRIRTAQLKKNKYSKKYAYLEENKYFLVSPTWIRYSDLGKNPNEIHQIL